MRAVEGDTEGVHRGDRARGESVTADLVATVLTLFEENNRGATPGRGHRRRGTRRTTTDDGYIDTSTGHGVSAGAPDGSASAIRRWC
jgi:hypothetical protein